MLEFLRDPMWQSIGALFALIAILMTIIVFKLQERRKAISYTITKIPFLSIKEKFTGRLKVLYNDKEVEDLYYFGISIFCTGNTPIRSEDYEKPITICWGEDSKIISVEIIRTIPASLNINTEVVNDKIFIQPVLLNSEDTFKMRCLVIRPSDKIDIFTRIVGIKEIKELRTNYLPYFYFSFIGIIIASIGLDILILNNIELSRGPDLVWAIAFIIFGFLTQVILLSYSVYKSYKILKMRGEISSIKDTFQLVYSMIKKEF